jgi:hypothetical protein
LLFILLSKLLVASENMPCEYARMKWYKLQTSKKAHLLQLNYQIPKVFQTGKSDMVSNLLKSQEFNPK